MSISMGNHNPPDLGEFRGDIHLKWLNPSGQGDRLNLDAGWASGLNDYNIRYQIPINSSHTMVALTASKTDTLIVSPSFLGLDIRSKSQLQNISLIHPLWLSSSNTVRLSLAYEHRRTIISIMGIPFSFAVGGIAKAIHAHTLQFSQQWQHQGLGRTASFNSRFTLGLGPVSATPPDGRFVQWLGQTHWIERWALFSSHSLARVTARLSNRSLMPSDKFSVGGAGSVRGYREN